MRSTRPSEWAREERDRSITQEALWYELDLVRRRVDAQFRMLGRRGERVARYPEHWRDQSVFDPATILVFVMTAISLACVVVVLLADRG